MLGQIDNHSRVRNVIFELRISQPSQDPTSAPRRQARGCQEQADKYAEVESTLHRRRQ